MEDSDLLSHVRVWRAPAIYNIPAKWHAEAVSCVGIDYYLRMDFSEQFIQFKSEFQLITDWVKFDCPVFVLNGVLEFTSIEELTRAIMRYEKKLAA